MGRGGYWGMELYSEAHLNTSYLFIVRFMCEGGEPEMDFSISVWLENLMEACRIVYVDSLTL